MKKLDVAFFGASCDTLELNKKFSEKLDLTYPLLSDTDASVAKAYGIYNGRFSKRVTFIIDKEGKIAHIDTKVSVRSHGKDLVAKLKELQK